MRKGRWWVDGRGQSLVQKEGVECEKGELSAKGGGVEYRRGGLEWRRGELSAEGRS